MERREHYDPEDIESLLQERGFDDLLEEERAYVLRHLSGREEYEAMRALLNNVRDDDRRRAPITADPQLRTDLMGLFRAQQKPQWQIWLNSVGTFIWPKETSDLWRPALALASLAVLITAGVWVLRQSDVQEQQLAELKPEKAKAEAPVKPEANDETIVEAEKQRGFNKTETEAEQAEVIENSVLAQKREEAPAPSESFKFAEAEYAAAADDAQAVKETEDVAMTRSGASPVTVAPTHNLDNAAAAPAATGSHVVTMNEMAVNQSVANATGKVTLSKNLESANRAATLVSNSPELVTLLAAGW
ncbi:MAG TPA: hypothetical protein PKY96_02330 [Flavobacteriales bacterium]|nr:hypothetical protein [Flavobacteriales bacterium]